uniref:Uncharacterized protein n=1 Tax=Anguilla anguilla TaxID=7936 RepID=A0A0E9VMM7_ANGAN
MKDIRMCSHSQCKIISYIIQKQY